MANVTDPLVSQLSGTDPQNLMEYITRQKIYDSRFWKEECFGLTVSDVLEKCCTQLQTIGPLPCHCLKLTLKLLQLNPEHDLVQKAFVEQDEFKYARAIGCLYIRLTSRPAEIYTSLEACYADFRKLRLWRAQSQTWDIVRLDEYVHELLTPAAVTNCLGMALPRLPARRVLQEAGYLPDGPRPTALQDVLHDYYNDDNNTDSDMDTGGPVLRYLKHKAFVEECPAAIRAWEARQLQFPELASRKQPRHEEQDNSNNSKNDGMSDRHEKKTKSKKKERNYDNLFKKSSQTSSKKLH